MNENKVLLTKQGNLYKIELNNNNAFIIKKCLISYPIELINKIIEIKGIESLCDDIQRDQKYSYIQKPLENLIFSHYDKQDFYKKRILDFGCGAGNSTVILGRILKKTEIVGVELDNKLLDLAEHRKSFYKLSNIKFCASKSGTELPADIGRFDFIFMNAVYEHLLPNERKIFFPTIWNLLNNNGSLLINETPHKWFPVETHTTEVLPFINYLPDKIVHFIVNNFSKRLKKEKFIWEQLLRSGLRVGSVKELTKILKLNRCKFELLTPVKLGIKDRVELFNRSLEDDWLSPQKRKILYKILKLIKITTGIILTPTLTFVIKKTIYSETFK